MAQFIEALHAICCLSGKAATNGVAEIEYPPVWIFE